MLSRQLKTTLSLCTLLAITGCDPFKSVGEVEPRDDEENCEGDSHEDDGADSADDGEAGEDEGDPTAEDDGGADEGADEGDPTEGADDGGDTSEGLACDIWAQNCAEGEKCAPYANDGGNVWNDARCVPVVDAPQPTGAPCDVIDGPLSGFDSCDVGGLCWNVDPETGSGTCIDLCGGAEDAPVCDEGSACSIFNQGVLPLCLPYCDPLGQDCADGEGCYPIDGEFACAPDFSGEEEGQPGDACEFVNACDAGTFCGTANEVPGCENAGCCTAFCTPGNDASCLDGQSCVPWFEDGEAPTPALQGVGACTAAG